MSYPVARTILMQVNNAKQLRQLEENSPHLEGDDAECWLRLINRDFPVLSKRYNFEPKNPNSWHKIYARYERLEADQKREAEEKLKAAFAGIKKEKAENVSTIVDFDRRKLPRPPLDGRGPIGGSRKAAGRRGGGPDESDLRFTSGIRTKTTTGKSILRKARREAREIQHRNRLATPTGLLPVQRGQIAAAPKGMVEAARIKAQPATRIQAPGGAPGRSNSSSTIAEQKRARELEEREARLRKMKNTQKDATVVSDSELEDEVDEDEDQEDDDDHGGLFDGDEDGDGDDVAGGLDAEDLEDLFDETSKPAPARTGAKTPTSYSKTSPTKRSGLLSDAPGSSRNAITTRSGAAPRSAPTQSSSSSASPMAAAPTGSKSAGAGAGSPEPGRSHGPPPPGMPRKRKPVDIFMKPKAKTQRR